METTKSSSLIESFTTVDDDLLIAFKSGRDYAYHDAGHLAVALQRTESQGRFFNRNIRGRFPSTKL